MDVNELNELRSIEELTNKQGQVKAEITAIEAEFHGLPLPEDARERYATLVETNEEIDQRVVELDKREKYLKHIGQNGGSDPARVTPAWEAPKTERASLKERDIYDLSNVRFNPENPESGRHEYRDRAMRAVELAHFPEYLPKERVQEHIGRLLDEARRQQVAAPGDDLLITNGCQAADDRAGVRDPGVEALTGSSPVASSRPVRHSTGRPSESG